MNLNFMPTITIATFNCENLFRRFKFSTTLTKPQVDNAVENGFIVNRALFETVPQPERKLTARMIKDTNADIIALQEVENLDTLKNFCSEHNLSSAYPYKLLIDGNDPRLIDVAVLSKIPFTKVNTHQYLKNSKKDWVFSRDCLELEFVIDEKPFTLFINHLKSMFDRADPVNGRAKTADKRKEQVSALLRILLDRFGRKNSTAAFAMVGDFNDYPSGDSSLKELFETKWLSNVVDLLPVEERWTHFWDNNKLSEAERYCQLDYLWMSKGIMKLNAGTLPIINRKGLSKKAKHPVIGKRYPEIEESTKVIAASDHCSVAYKFTF